MRSDDATGILLPSGETGTSFLHRVLREVEAASGDALRGASLPADPADFRRGYGDAVVRFEAARIASPRRVEIAAALVEATLGSLRLADGTSVAPLREALAAPAAAPRLEARVGSDRPRFGLQVPCDGVVHRGAAVADLVHDLHAQRHLTDAARDGLLWIVRRVVADGGALDLRGQRFAVLGAGAELSPVPLLLGGGATVLWIDKAPPPAALLADAGAGELIHVEGGSDVLADPRRVAAALRRFATRGPVHVGLYAYAPGASRELRLAAGMDAIVRSLGPEMVRSVSMLVSPTSPGEMQREDVSAQEARRASHPLWQRALSVSRALRGPGRVGDAAPVCRSVMAIQGAGYQAAQYLGKIVTSEALAVDGVDGRGPLTVSANVAGITATRSLAHPLFQVAFAGAPAFGVRIFEPATTRALSGLLMLHDLLNPDAPAAAARVHARPDDRARALRSAQIHGGVPAVPWQFESAVQAAALVGSIRRPDLLLRLGRAGEFDAARA